MLLQINCMWENFGARVKMKKYGKRRTKDTTKGKVGWHSTKWLKADCLGLGGNWQPKDLSGQEVSTDHLYGRVCMRTADREEETHRKMKLTRLPSAGLKYTEGRRTRERDWELQVVWGHIDETEPSQKESLSENERHRWAGRKRGRGWQIEGGKAVSSPHPSFPASSAVLAVPRSGKERLPKPSLRLHVWTQSLPLPCLQMALLSEYKPVSVCSPPDPARHAPQLSRLDLAGKL